jgi:hypothetical protein
MYIATEHNTEKNSKDVKNLFIAACMSSSGCTQLCLAFGEGRGRGEINGFSSSGR